MRIFLVHVGDLCPVPQLGDREAGCLGPSRVPSPLGLLIGFRSSDVHESGAVVPELDIVDGQGRDFRDPQQGVAHDGDEGRIPQVAGLPAALEGEAEGIGGQRRERADRFGGHGGRY